MIEDRDLLWQIRENARQSVRPYDVSQIAPQVMGVYGFLFNAVLSLGTHVAVMVIPHRTV